MILHHEIFTFSADYLVIVMKIMNILLKIGTSIVILALASYSIAVITEQIKHKISNLVLFFLTAGIILDISATVFMILGSSNTPFTLHGIMGYSSLGAMLADTFILWRFRLKNGRDAEVAKGIHLFSRYAFSWWVLAFITGAVIAVSK